MKGFVARLLPKRKKTRRSTTAARASTTAAAVSGAARRQAAAYAMAVLGATAATGHKRRPRGMGGSGLPFARHEGLEGRPLASNFMRNEPFGSKYAVRIGPHSFSKWNLRRMLAVNPRAVNPLTRQPLPERVHRRYGPPPPPPSPPNNNNNNGNEQVPVFEGRVRLDAIRSLVRSPGMASFASFIVHLIHVARLKAQTLGRQREPFDETPLPQDGAFFQLGPWGNLWCKRLGAHRFQMVHLWEHDNTWGIGIVCLAQTDAGTFTISSDVLGFEDRYRYDEREARFKRQRVALADTGLDGRLASEMLQLIRKADDDWDPLQINIQNAAGRRMRW